MRGRGWATLLLLLSCDCAGGGGGGEASHPRSAGGAPASDAPVKIGAPYTAGGNRYVPADDRFYDAVGVASWYGAESGVRTAGGEPLDADAWTAAHPTLPLPSYVEVTALATGRTIVVRVNDRGPFARDRLIDLSAAAAKALGIAQDGSAPVRVRRVFPPEQERAALRAGQPGAARLGASPQLLAVLRARLAAGQGRPVLLSSGPMPDPKAMADGAAMAGAAALPDRGATAGPMPAPAAAAVQAASPHRLPSPRAAPAARPPALVKAPPPPAAATGHGSYVQVGAFGDAARARRIAGEVGGQVSATGALSRVRVGPFADDAATRGALAKLRARGYGGATIVHD